MQPTYKFTKKNLFHDRSNSRVFEKVGTSISINITVLFIKLTEKNSLLEIFFNQKQNHTKNIWNKNLKQTGTQLLSSKYKTRIMN